MLSNPHDALAVIGNHTEHVLHIPVPDIHHLVDALSQTLFDAINTTVESMKSRLIQQDSDQSQNRRRRDNHPELKLTSSLEFGSNPATDRPLSAIAQLSTPQSREQRPPLVPRAPSLSSVPSVVKPLSRSQPPKQARHPLQIHRLRPRLR